MGEASCILAARNVATVNRFLHLTGLYPIVVDQGKRFAAMKLMSNKIRETDVKAHLAFFDAI